MRTIFVYLFIAVAIVSTVALYPGSSWVFLNQYDLLTKQNPANNLSNDNVVGSFVPGWVTQAETYSGPSDAEQLTHALYLHRPEREPALNQYARSHASDPVALAAVARMSCMAGGSYPDAPKERYQEYLKLQAPSLNNAILACLGGERLEPNNAYFPLMRAVFCMESNRLADMSQALKAAGQMTGYNSHLHDQVREMEDAARLAKGYRGELVRTAVQASVLLPDFAHIKSLSRYLNRHGTLQQKRDLMQTLYMMGRGEDTGIGFLVALGSFRIALSDPVPVDEARKVNHTDADWLQLVSKFDDQLKAAHVQPLDPATLTEYNGLKKLVDAFQKYVESRTSMFDNAGNDGWSYRLTAIGIVVPFLALLALLLALVFGGISLGFSRIQSDVFRAMVPHIICLPIVWVVWASLISCCETQKIITGMACAVCQSTLAFMRLGKRAAIALTALTALGAWLLVLQTPLVLNPLLLGFLVLYTGMAFLPWVLDLERRQQIATLGGAAVAVLSIITLDPAAIVAGISYGIAVGLVWLNKRDETPKVASWLTAVTYVLLCGTGGCLITAVWVAGGDFKSSIWAAGFVGLVGSALFVRKSFATTKAAICASLAVFSGVYLLSVGLQLRENHRQSLSELNLANEARNIRQSVGNI